MQCLNTLKILRERENLTQVEIAEKLNISPQRYYLYEKGKRRLPVKLAKKLADYYGVTLEEIFFGD